MSEFLKGLQEARAKKLEAAKLAVEKFARVPIVGDAQEMCPVDTGALQASGTVEEATVKGDLIEVEFGFNVSYAAAVHENLTARHSQGQAKFLEASMQQNKDKFGPFMAAEMSRQ